MSDINDFVIEDGVLIKYKGREQIIKIPESVTSIGDCAFIFCPVLTLLGISMLVKFVQP